MTSGFLDPSDVRFFSGSSHPQLARDIARHLGVPLEKTKISRFSNDNLYLQLGSSVRSRKIYIVQSLNPPVNDHLMELFMMLDIARTAGAREVHAIIPYFSFARSDKKDAPRISITAKLIADLLQSAGATHVMTMRLHSPQVHGFFGVPTDPLTSRPIINHYLRDRDFTDTVVVAPDAGAAKSASRFARVLGLPMAAGNKERVSDTEVRISNFVGDRIQGCRRALIYDDEIATGGSIITVANLLIELGIEEIIVTCTHGVFVKDGLERLVAIPQIKEIVATDTVYLPPEKHHPKLHILSVAPIFGEAIRRNYLRESIGDLFSYWDE
ncbi:MAG: ribose-phosphate pyrophosphokinase [Chloroflexota bacterium]